MSININNLDEGLTPRGASLLSGNETVLDNLRELSEEELQISGGGKKGGSTVVVTGGGGGFVPFAPSRQFPAGGFFPASSPTVVVSGGGKKGGGSTVVTGSGGFGGGSPTVVTGGDD